MAEVVAPVDLPFLQIYVSDGKQFAYYRRNGRRVRIRAEVGSEAFPAAYEAARQAWQAKPTPTIQPAADDGTLAALIALYRLAPEYRKKLALKTQKDYDRVLDMIGRRFGTVKVTSLNREWVFRMRDEAQDTPRTANFRVAVIRLLLNFGLSREFGKLAHNAALQVDNLDTGEGFRVWTEGEIAAMTGPAAGDVALPVLIARWTALRQIDVLTLGWNAYTGHSIRVRARKTAKHTKHDAPLVVPVEPELRAVLDPLKETKTGLVICTRADGQSWASDHFRHRFAEVRTALKLPADLHFHGLRPTRLTELAQAGASDAELQAYAGHKTRAMAAHYTRSAQQEQLAIAAVVRLRKRRKKT
jgi:integrase